MAKKTRTPAPPRPVQAPRRRTSSGPRISDERRTRLLLVLFVLAGVIGLAVVIGVIVLTRGGGSSSSSPTGVANTMQAAGCTVQTANSKSHNHVSSLSAKIKYNTTPPSNGNHYYQPAVWGFYTTAANPIQVVHNQEHGGVILWWGNKVPQSTIDQLRSFYDSSPNAMFGTPYPSLGNKIAISAWPSPPGGLGKGVVATCAAFNEKAFKTFRDAYRGKGRERYPMSIETPGS